MGKVNSARTTQILIDNFDIKYVINVGVAGGLNDDLEIGDIVIGKKLVQHDFDITALGCPRGFISEELGKDFISDTNLVSKCEKIIKDEIKEINVKIGIIATGDVFCNKVSLKEEVVKEFNADCIEMEGAAIAQVCTLCNIPFIVIRSISDKPNGHNEIDFNTYLEMSVKRYQKLIKKLI